MKGNSEYTTLPDCKQQAKPLVTVITPTHNRSDLLTRSVNSVLAQTHDHLELIIVDDCSSDDTPAVARSLMASDSRVRYIRNAQNLHAPQSRNVALEAARGEFVAFLDDDDEWMPQKLELQLKLANRYAVVGCLYHKNRRPSHLPHITGEPPFAEKTVEAFHFQSTGFCPGSMLTRTSLMREIGGFDRELPGPEGIDLFIRLVSRFGTAAYITLPLHVYYTHEQHGKPRITTSDRLIDTSMLELEKNRHLRSARAYKLRRCKIELIRAAHARHVAAKAGYLLRSLRFVDPTRPVRFLKLYANHVFSNWPGLRQCALAYRRVKYR